MGTMQAAGAVHGRPRFRQDLVAEAVEDQGARFIDVMDPDSGHMFRFYEVEYSLACAMDGERDVAGIVKWAQEELGLTPSTTEVQTVIATLVDLKFVDAGEAQETKAAAAITPSANDQELARGIVVGARASDSGRASAANDVELGHAGGGKAAHQAEMPKAPDLALGSSGASAVRGGPGAPVEDVALGASGARAADSKVAARFSDKPADVSIDLSEHLSVKPDDVKEAVRASKVMSAAEVPKDLLDAIEDKPAEKAAEKPAAAAKVAEKPAAQAKAAEKAEPAAAKAAEKAAEKPAAAAKAAEKAEPAAAAKAPERAEPAGQGKAPEKAADKQAGQGKASEKAADKQAGQGKASEKAADKQAGQGKAPEKAADKQAGQGKASEKAADKQAGQGKASEKAAKGKSAGDQTKPPVVEKPPVAAPRGGISPMLVILLILAVGGAGAFFVWKYVIDKPEAPAAPSAQTSPAPADPVPVPVPAPPAVVTSKVAMQTPTPTDVKSQAGKIDTLEADDKDVKTGDVIGMLVGHKPITAEIDAINKDIEKRVQVELTTAEKERDAAQAAGNKAGVTTAEAKIADRKKSLATKQATLTTKRAAIDKLTLKSPGDGKLSLIAKVGQVVAVDEVVAKIVRPTVPVATFKVPAGTKISPDGKLSISMGDKPVVCTVSDAQQETVTVTCPTDAGLTDGADVTFTLPR